MNKHTHCLICNGTGLQQLSGSYERHGLVKCTTCSFVFMDRIPSYEVLAKHYSNYDYGGERTVPIETTRSYNELLDEFEAYRKSGRILDVGCGRGWFLDAAKIRGWEVHGTEFSPTAVALREAKGISMMKVFWIPNDLMEQPSM